MFLYFLCIISCQTCLIRFFCHPLLKLELFLRVYINHTDKPQCRKVLCWKSDRIWKIVYSVLIPKDVSARSLSPRFHCSGITRKKSLETLSVRWLMLSLSLCVFVCVSLLLLLLFVVWLIQGRLTAWDNIPSPFLPAYLYAAADSQSLSAEMELDASLMHHCPYLISAKKERESRKKKKKERRWSHPG